MICRDIELSEFVCNNFEFIVRTFLILALFVLGQYINFRFRRNEIRRSTYLKVFLEPNLDLISEYFDKLDKLADSVLSTDISELGDLDDFHKFLVDKQLQFSNHKTNLKFRFIDLISISYPKVSEKLNELIMGLEDEFVISIQSLNNSEDGIQDFRKKLVDFKIGFYEIINKPLKKRSW